MNATTRKNPVFLVFLLFAGLVVSGCAAKSPGSDSLVQGYGSERADRDSMTPAERFVYDYRSAALARMQEDNDVPLSKALLIETAKTAIGTPYVRGGVSTDGFDCSGFVQWAFKNVGVKLPRTAREQSTVGTPVRDFEDLIAGDIVAFKHPRRGYHTGIYVGDGKFIHSPRKRTRVRINSLSDPYFNSTFLGARRISVDDNDLEAAQTLLAAYESEQKTKTRMDSSSRLTSRDLEKKSERKKTSKSALKAEKSKKKTSARSETKSSKKNEKARSTASRDKKIASSSKKTKASSKASSKSSSKSKSSNTKPSKASGKKVASR